MMKLSQTKFFIAYIQVLICELMRLKIFNYTLIFLEFKICGTFFSNHGRCMKITLIYKLKHNFCNRNLNKILSTMNINTVLLHHAPHLYWLMGPSPYRNCNKHISSQYKFLSLTYVDSLVNFITGYQKRKKSVQ